MLRYWLEIVGVGVFAVSGALVAGRKGFDWVGVIVIASVTAIGGGTLRDLLLGRFPLFWMADGNYLWVILGSSLLTIIYTRFRKAPDAALLVADGIGLAAFSIAGARIAEMDHHFAAPVIIVLGTMTGVAGGMLRDVLVSEVPFILRPGHFYATACMAGIGAYLLLSRFALTEHFAALIGMGVVATLRFSAIRWDLRLPAFELKDD